MRKPNYQHAKKQKEQARKARQDEKQQRRSTRTNDAPGEEGATEAADTPATQEPVSGEGS